MILIVKYLNKLLVCPSCYKLEWINVRGSWCFICISDRVLEENSSYEEDEFYSSDGSDSANEIAPEVQVNSFHPISIEMFISYG